MVKFNLLRILKKPLPPATPREVVDVCAAAFLFCCVAGIIVFGFVKIISYFLR